MSEQNRGQDFLLSLDQELKAMASEVPDMPEEFRSGWRQAIRAEADQPSADSPETPAFPETHPSPEASSSPEVPSSPAGPDRAEPASGNVRSLRPRRWSAVLSAAAAMIFLIGGTLATRGSLSPRLRRAEVAVSGPVENTAVRTDAEQEEEEENTLYAAKEEADLAYAFPEEAAEEASAVWENTADEVSAAWENTAEEASAAWEEAAEEDSAAWEETAAEAPVGSGAGSSAVNTDRAGESAEDVSRGEEASGKKAKTSASGSLQAVPEATASAAPLPTISPEPAAAPAETPPGFWTGVGYFLEDMGAFLLAALPYLAGAAAAGALVFLFRRRKH